VNSELIELSTVIGDIYDAAIDPGEWQQALASICAYTGGHSAALFWHDAATQASAVLHMFNHDPHYTQLYFEKFIPMNPLFPAAAFIEAGVIHSPGDIVPQEEFEQTRFYKEWVVPQGLVDTLAVNLEKGATRASMLSVRTDATYGMADDEMRRRVALLFPHVHRAVTIGRLFDQSGATQRALAEVLGHIEAAVFLVGRNGTITFTNDPAKAMLKEAVLVREENGALRAAAADADRILRETFESAENGDAAVGLRGVAAALTDPSQERWFAHVLPLTSGRRRQAGLAHAAVAAVFVRRTAPNAPLPLEALAKLYKLTASEVRVLDAVLKVTGVKAIAEMLGISQATVKTHLNSIFRKTPAKNQNGLIKLILASEPHRR
jgi:DNA-binding NarL/FixJ family response regulator